MSDLATEVVEFSPTHTVLFCLPFVAGSNTPPAPAGNGCEDTWDDDHVRLPCSSHSLYPRQNSGSCGSRLEPRWSLIERALQAPFTSCDDIERVIKSYNIRFQHRWDFGGLRRFIDEELTEEETDVFLTRTLPAIARLALRLPQLLRRSLPLLRRHRTHSISLSQEQVACLLANAFFCTFPRRNNTAGAARNSGCGARADSSSSVQCRSCATIGSTRVLPDINMNRLFSASGSSGAVLRRRQEKLKCVLHYFQRVTSHMPPGVITFTRRSLSSRHLPDWSTCSRRMLPLRVTSDQLIEDQQGLLQVDFANRLIGGGVLGSGCLQEEIRFVCQPELLTACLLTERLCDTEAVLVFGAEWFNRTTGYGDSFVWRGKLNDVTARDKYGRRDNQLVAIDALDFHSADCLSLVRNISVRVNSNLQYQPACIERELNKAFAGFDSGAVSDNLEDTCLPAVATGNWGCGAFGGDAGLKSVLQLMAASAASRRIVYCTFGDVDLERRIAKLSTILHQRCVTVGRVADILFNMAASDVHGCVVDWLTRCLSIDTLGCHSNDTITTESHDGNSAIVGDNDNCSNTGLDESPVLGSIAEHSLLSDDTEGQRESVFGEEGPFRDSQSSPVEVKRSKTDIRHYFQNMSH